MHLRLRGDRPWHCSAVRRQFLAILALLAACDGAEYADPDAPHTQIDTEPRSRLVARIVQTVGDGQGDRELGGVAGVARDGEGRAFVVDRTNQRVAVVADSGAWLTWIGREGRGPGEFLSPCCPSVDPRSGHLWVRDGGNLRLTAFEETPDGIWRPVRTARTGAGVREQDVPVAFPAGDGVLDVVADRDFERGRITHSRYLVDPDGGRRHVGPIEPIEADDHAYSYAARSGGRSAGTFFLPPLGRRNLLAVGRNGSFATASTAEYLIRWYDASGALQRTIGRTLPKRPLTEAERRLRDAPCHMVPADVCETVRRAQPDVAPLLSYLRIDREGRLWIFLHGQTPADGRADVLAPDGSYLHSVEYPGHVNFRHGAVGTRIAWGTITVSFGVERLVRVRLEDAPPRETAALPSRGE